MRVAVVGSGPAGFYAAGALLSADPPAEVDMIERLPTPWGLVRLGVAPDHPKLKSVSRAFERIAEQPGFRFLGNVEVGRDLHHSDLVRLYDAVLYAVGAQTDRRLGIPGEDLPGSWPATEFVAWYNGHPDYQQVEFDLDVERAVVIGVGNVALDIARMLALTQEELAPTDATDASIAAIASSPIREIVVVGRRGPAQAAFTTPELHEMGELAGADVVVDPADLDGAEPQGTNAERNLAVLQESRGARAGGQATPRRLPLLPVAGRDSRRGEGRGHRARPQQARRERSGRADGGARDARVRVWSSAASAIGASSCRVSSSTRRAARFRTRVDAWSRASTAPAGSSAARPG